MSKKMLATHPNPHLDDICGIWLLLRFHPRYQDSSVQFIPQGVDFDGAITGIGIGKGKYDEHKGDVFEAATTLVWADVQEFVVDSYQRRALQEIVQWVRDEDHAKFMGTDRHEYSIAVTAMSLVKVDGEDSATVLEWGMRALDALLVTITEKQMLLDDWNEKRVCDTQWGKAVALRTFVASAHVGRKSMREGYNMFIVENPQNGYRYLKSAVREANVDLTEAYAKVCELEPESEWYLHHSKRMLICGSDVAQNLHLSKLTLDQLMDLVRIT